MNQEDAILDIFEHANNYIPIFQALADSQRLLILLKLFYAGQRGKNVTELSGRVSLSRPAVSHHLKVLKSAGIIDSHKEGTQVYYYLDTKRKVSLIDEVIKKLQNHMTAIDLNHSEPDDEAMERIVTKACALIK